MRASRACMCTMQCVHKHTTYPADFSYHTAEAYRHVVRSAGGSVGIDVHQPPSDKTVEELLQVALQLDEDMQGLAWDKICNRIDPGVVKARLSKARKNVLP